MPSTFTRFQTTQPHNNIKQGQEGIPKDMIYQDGTNLSLHLGDVMTANDQVYGVTPITNHNTAVIRILQSKNLIKQLILKVTLASDISKHAAYTTQITQDPFLADYKLHRHVEEITYQLPGSERIVIRPSVNLEEVLNQMDNSEVREQYRLQNGASHYEYKAGDVLKMLIALPSMISSHDTHLRPKPFPLHLAGDDLELNIRWGDLLNISSAEIELVYDDLASNDLYKMGIHRHFCRLGYQFRYEVPGSPVNTTKSIALRGLRPGETSELYVHVMPKFSQNGLVPYGTTASNIPDIGWSIPLEVGNNPFYGVKLKDLKLMYQNETIWEYRGEIYDLYNIWSSQNDSKFTDKVIFDRWDTTVGATHAVHPFLGQITGAYTAGTLEMGYESKSAFNSYNISKHKPMSYASHLYKIPLSAELDELNKNGYLLGVDFKGAELTLEFKLDCDLPNFPTHTVGGRTGNAAQAVNLCDCVCFVTQKLNTTIQFEGSNTNMIQ